MKKHSNNSFKKIINMKRFDGEANENQSSEITNLSSNTTNPKESSLSANPEQLLKKFCLKGNQLNGSVLIGNYNYLTHLEVIENEMEILDLSSLAQLDSLTCRNNKLMELMINCSNLTSLTTVNNYLRQINITSIPSKLKQVNISNNYFTELPKWLKDCVMLECLDASHNKLRDVSDFILYTKTSNLKTLNISYNYLRVIKKLPSCFSTLRYLELHYNELQLLSDNLLVITKDSLKELNLSNNKLQILPPVITLSKKCKNVYLDNGEQMVLEILKLSSNNFDDKIYEVLQTAKRLKALHAAYNKISSIPEIFLQNCTELQDLMLSGNQLQKIPANLCKLSKLKTLRIHSNLLLSVPYLDTMDMLQILDLANNHIEYLNVLSILPKNLKYLDLSFNNQLQLDEVQMQMSCSKRKLHLVDVSDKNRQSLFRIGQFNHDVEKIIHKPSWLVGFSETPGNCGKLQVIQLRESKFRHEEALFGMFSAEEVVSTSATKLSHIVSTLLQQCKTYKYNIGSLIKSTLLDFQKKLLDLSVVGANLCYISQEDSYPKNIDRLKKIKRYVLHVIGFGNIGIYLIRKTANIQLLVPQEPPIKSSKPLQSSLLESKWILNNEDEYLVICNSGIWSILDVDRIAREIRKEEDVVLAAKRVQDMVQSFGGQGNLSVITVCFKNMGTDVDNLIKEFKETLGRKSHSIAKNVCNECKYLCCGNTISCRQYLDSIYHSTGLSIRSDYSSPNGSGDATFSRLPYKPELELIQARGNVVEEPAEMETLDDTESALSEEQFKCWEYMLEQNTQLLFDKELGTISKSYIKTPLLENNIHKNPEHSDCLKISLLKAERQKFISASSPQLIYSEIKKPSLMFDRPNEQSSVSSNHFGSTCSFGMGYGLFSMNNKSQNSLTHHNYPIINGGPHAAYFGSLQRLKPFNQQHNFNLTKEGTIISEDEEIFGEHENRMRKYWAIATTEL